MSRSLFGVSKLCCSLPGDLTSLSEISSTPVGPPEIILGYVYTAFHFSFQDLDHVYWFMLCFPALCFGWRWPCAFPDWSETPLRSCSNACLAPVKHHSLNRSWWMFWSRVLLIACQTWLRNEHRPSALMRWSQDHIQSSFCSKGRHINFSNRLSYGCNSKSFAQCSQTNTLWKIMSWWKKIY